MDGGYEAEKITDSPQEAIRFFTSDWQNPISLGKVGVWLQTVE